MPGWDPMADSALIVEGIVTGWRIDEDTPPERVGSFERLPLDVTLAVDWVYKGEPIETLLFADSSLSREIRSRHTFWTGDGADCSAFPEDPTGLRLIASFSTDGAGKPSTNTLRLFYRESRSAPAWGTTKDARGKLSSLGLPRPTEGFFVRRWWALMGRTW